MGALTLKSFPFELRGWDIEKFDGIDPTDGFGSSTRVYISKQTIIQIEPDHSEKTSKAWLTDKGRQFFDGIFKTGNSRKDILEKNLILKRKSWRKNIKTLLKTLYLFEHCNVKVKKNNFLTIVFENLSIEMLSLLKIMEKEYSFLKLRRAEKLIVHNDMEFNFQLNSVTNSNQLKLSNLCLLIGTNPRYEGYKLNLDLRQRYLKGNFKCLRLGSLINLTFPTTSIGTNLKTLKSIAEGNSFVCQDFKTAKNALVILGEEIQKRVDGKQAIEMIKFFSSVNVFNPSWNSINVLHSSLSGAGTASIAHFPPVKIKDFVESSSFYFINVNAQTVPNLKKITEAKLLGFYNNCFASQPMIHKLFFDQNYNVENNRQFLHNSFNFSNEKQYNFLPTKMFYENQETFINTEGSIKRTKKLVTHTQTREGWKLLRNLAKHFKNSFKTLISKNDFILTFSTKKQLNFINFIHFHYCASDKIEALTPFLTHQTRPFFLRKKNTLFKKTVSKTRASKFKYWIEDFFTGGKDEYTRNSLTLSSCSKIIRKQSTNFL